MQLQVLTDIFLALPDRFPLRSLLMYRVKGEYRSISAEDFVKRTLRLAAGLEEIGVRRGDRIALVSENRPEWAATDFALLLLGAVTVPVYPSLPASQCRYLLEHSGARFAIVSTAGQLKKLLPLTREIPHLEGLIVMDPPTTVAGPVRAWNEVLTLGEKSGNLDLEGWRRRCGTLRPQDLASIIYTSGTTGRPKGVMLTHKNLCSNILAIARAMPLGAGDTILSFLPLSHVLERTTDYLCFFRGATIAYAALGDTLMNDFREICPTIVPTVPRLLEKIQSRVLAQVGGQSIWRRRLFHWAIGVGEKIRGEGTGTRPPSFPGRWADRLARRFVLDPLRERLVGRQFRFFMSGGAPLPVGIARFFQACGITVLQGYGLTETSPVVSINRPDRNRLGTVGPVLDGVQVRILGDGEILTRGSNVMKGYYRNETATRGVLRDGWFHTGDIGRLDKDGFLIITDRKKDLIKTSGGKLIAPQPLESLLREDEFIGEAVILGEGRRFISALIIPDFDHLARFAGEQGLPAGEMREIIRNPRVVALYKKRISKRMESCAKFETVKKFFLAPEPLKIEEGDLTPTQKVRRDRIAEKFRKEIEELYR